MEIKLSEDRFIEGEVVSAGTTIIVESVDKNGKTSHTKKVVKQKEKNMNEEKIQEKTRIEKGDRKKALIQFLGYDAEEAADVEEDQYGFYGTENAIFDTPDGEYAVVTEDEADEAFRDNQEQLMDDMGLDSFSPKFQKWIFDNAVSVSKLDTKFFIDDEVQAVIDSPDSYTSWFEDYGDIDKMKQELNKNRDFINAVREEKDDEDFVFEDYLDNMDMEEVLEAYNEYDDLASVAHDVVTEMLDKEYDGDVLEYYADTTGYSKAEVAGEHLANIVQIDYDAIYDEVKNLDGRGSSLAFYDGEENEITYEGIDFLIYRIN